MMLRHGLVNECLPFVDEMQRTHICMPAEGIQTIPSR